MLLNIKCEEIPQIYVELLFDDNSTKKKIISVNDLVDVYYNGNGLRKHIIGRVAAISTIGPDPKQWYVVVDGSDDFDAQKARFSPAAILDINIIRKYWQDQLIHTSTDKSEKVTHIKHTSDGQIQYSDDGYQFKFPKVDANDVIGLENLIKKYISESTKNDDKESKNAENVKDSDKSSDDKKESNESKNDDSLKDSSEKI